MIEAHCKNFLWSGSGIITKKSFVAWERVCTPKSTDGLDLTNMYIWNRADMSNYGRILSIRKTRYGSNGSTPTI